MSGTNFELLIDPAMAAQLISDGACVRQMQLLDQDGLSKFSDKLGVRFSADQILSLWEIGLLPADEVITQQQLEIEGMHEIESDRIGIHKYVGRRILIKPADGWILRPESSKRPAYQLFFHPFRFHSLYRMLFNLQIIRISPTLDLVSAESFGRVHNQAVGWLHEWIQSADFQQQWPYWNSIGDLSILAEPRFFADVFHHSTFHPSLKYEEHLAKVDELWQRLLPTYRQIGLKKLSDAHQLLCMDAQRLEPNQDIHLLIRFMHHEDRKKIKGDLGGAVHMNSMAEIVRRAAEYAFDTKLPEEQYHGFGINLPRISENLYGSDRLVDSSDVIKLTFLRHLGLDFSAKVRIYVEGDTEFGAVNSVLGGETSVEIVNLRAQVSAKGGKVLTFRDSLERDLKSHVFSFVLFDKDSAENVRAFTKAVSDDVFFGVFLLSDPDFETHNFLAPELVEVLVQWAMEQGESPDTASLTETLKPHCVEKDGSARVANINEFLKAAQSHFGGRVRFPKSKEWGAKLGSLGFGRPDMESKNGKTRRPFFEFALSAFRSVSADYWYWRKNYKVDLKTRDLVKR